LEGTFFFQILIFQLENIKDMVADLFSEDQLVSIPTTLDAANKFNCSRLRWRVGKHLAENYQSYKKSNQLKSLSLDILKGIVQVPRNNSNISGSKSNVGK
jgi:hypothetical protein